MHFDNSLGLEPITCSVKAAVAATGLRKDSLYRLMNEQVLESSTVGGRRVIFVESLRAHLDSCRFRKGGAA